jgi:hypothetical protein
MLNTPSERIIQFLSSLAHFQGDQNREGVFFAQRITDGTFFLPHPDIEGQAGGLLVAHWQADPARTSIAHGAQIAEQEIVTAVRHWVTVGEMQDERQSIRQLFQHFTLKTGESISFVENNEEFTKSLKKLLKDLGWSGFKKLIGF